MLNTLNGLVAALNCYDINTSSWDCILIYHISRRFDKQTLSKWEDKLDGRRTIPKLKTLIEFLQVRITVNQTSETFNEPQQSDNRNKQTRIQATHKPNNDQKRTNDKFKSFFTLKETYECALCGKNHLPSRCTDIIRMNLRERQARIKKNGLCENCFYPHPVSNCPFKPACKKCNGTHHTLLHSDGKQMFMNVVQPSDSTEAPDSG